MKRPGARLRAAAVRWCSDTTMARIVDPALADLQLEWEVAAQGGRRWHCRWVLVLGYWGLLKALALCGCRRIAGLSSNSSAGERATVFRAGAVSLFVMLAAMLLLVAPYLETTAQLERANRAVLVWYLLPSAFPLAVPVGLLFGLLWSVDRVTISRRVVLVAVMLATLVSAASFVTLGWITPAANQAFRTTVVGRPVERGLRELTLTELGGSVETRLTASVSTRQRRAEYHVRIAVSFATMALTVFALSLRSRRRLIRLALGIVACTAYLVCLASASTIWDPIAAAWLPNLVLVGASAALVRDSSGMIQRRDTPQE
jgi:lipopolysaccharide export system permease LptF/LptG-like protein